MDPFTHALTGVVAGQAFIFEKDSIGLARQRVARTALVLGAVFPDIDLIANPFEPYGLGTIHYHRAVTHSVVCLPVFAVLLSTLAVWFCRWRRIERPSWTGLTALFGVGIGLHIAFDLITSFGTMMWSPMSWGYVSWDTTFIVDPVLTLILLLPLMLAWIYSRVEKASQRTVFLWLGLSVAASAVVIADRKFQAIAASGGAGYENPAITWPGTLWAAALVLLALGVLLGAPAIARRGLRVARRNWFVGGIVATGIYLGVSAGAHAVALRRVEDFARSRGLQIQKIGALPMPPSFLFWSGLISTPDRVYHSYFSLLDGQAPQFDEYRQSRADAEIRQAMTLPDVQILYRFFRFPLIVDHSLYGASTRVLSFHDLRFLPQIGKTLPFSYEVEVDKSTGKAVYRGKPRMWIR